MRTKLAPIECRNHQYDFVIVGCGAAGIGLLYGLLEPYDTSKPNFRIAVIERGGGNDEHDDGNGKSEYIISKQQPTNSKDPKRWFKASHPPPLFRNKNDSDAIIYDSVPQCGLHNRVLTIPTGKRLGGGTNINATLLSKPSEDDFINWPDIWKKKRRNRSPSTMASSSKIMSAIETIENAMGFSLNNGKLCRENMCGLRSQNYELFPSDGDYIQIKSIADLNNVKLNSFNYSVKRTENHTKNDSIDGLDYERVNAYQALIAPLLERNPILKEAVHFYTDIQVERLLIEKMSTSSSHEYIVKGVECKQIRQTKYHCYFNIMAERKVILCAGAILSPALLLTSGIGNPNELGNEGIKPLLSSCKTRNQWNGVGKNFRDHFIVTKAIFIPKQNFWSTMKSINAVRGYAALDIGDGPMSSRVFFKIMDGTTSSFILPHVLASFFHRRYERCWKGGSKSCIGGTNLFACGFNHLSKIVFYIMYIILSILLCLSPLTWLLSHHTANILLCLLNPESTGSITIQRKNKVNSTSISLQHVPNRLSDFNIIVNPGYLTNDVDIIRIKNSMLIMDELSKQWFPNCYELLPGLIYKSIYGKNDYISYAKDVGLPYFHFSGSIAMNINNTKTTANSNDNDNSNYFYVVDERLNVRNVMNLHVCDASIFPGNISGPTALTCLGVGYVAASFFIGDDGNPCI